MLAIKVNHNSSHIDKVATNGLDAMRIDANAAETSGNIDPTSVPPGKSRRPPEQSPAPGPTADRFRSNLALGWETELFRRRCTSHWSLQNSLPRQYYLNLRVLNLDVFAGLWKNMLLLWMKPTRRIVNDLDSIKGPSGDAYLKFVVSLLQVATHVLRVNAPRTKPICRGLNRARTPCRFRGEER